MLDLRMHVYVKHTEAPIVTAACELEDTISTPPSQPVDRTYMGDTENMLSETLGTTGRIVSLSVYFTNKLRLDIFTRSGDAVYPDIPALRANSQEQVAETAFYHVHCRRSLGQLDTCSSGPLVLGIGSHPKLDLSLSSIW